MVRLRQTLDWLAWMYLVCCFSGQWTAFAAPGVLSVPAGDFLGDDGDWTAFKFNIGTPPQPLNFFPSTSSSQFLSVIQRGCPDNIPDCPTNRGGIYDPSASSTWRDNGDGIANVTLLQNFNISVSATFGSETIAIPGATVKQQAFSQISQYGYFVGIAGLHIWDDISSASNEDQTDYISLLKGAGAIPTLTFGYTAGAKNRLKGVPGSLTFGGYDQSRFDPSRQIVVDFNSSNERDIALTISHINTNYNGTTTQLLPDSVDVLIDSTLSDIWLPQEACERFEDVFKLHWNSSSQLYYINPADHETLSTANPNITFTLVNPSDSTSTDFVLPYSAFDQSASWPRYDNYPNTVNYFPLRRASNENQYTLGRAFLQETYIFVNFENGTYTLAPAVFSDSLPPNLFTFWANGTASSGSSASAAAGSSGNNSGGGSTNSAAIGAGVGVPVGVLLIAGIGGFFWFRRRKSKQQAMASEKGGFDTNTTMPSSGAGAAAAATKTNKTQMNTGIDHEIFEVGSPTSPTKNGPTELDAASDGAPVVAGTTKKLSRGASSDDVGGRRAELGTSFAGAELASAYPGAELGTQYSGADAELQGSPVMSAVEIASIPSPTLSAARSGTVSPMTATSPGPSSPHIRAMHSSHGMHSGAGAQAGKLGIPRSAPSPDGHPTAESAGAPRRPNLLRNPSSTEQI